MTLDLHADIGSVLAQICDASPEECSKEAASIHPEDRQRTEEFMQSIGGWERFASYFPYMVSKASEEELFGLMEHPKRVTIIGHALIARERGIALHVQRLM